MEPNEEDQIPPSILAMMQATGCSQEEAMQAAQELLERVEADKLLTRLRQPRGAWRGIKHQSQKHHRKSARQRQGAGR